MGADVSGAFTSLDPGILGDKVLHNLALSKSALGDWPAAREAWERALALGGRPAIGMALLEAALESGDLAVVRKVLAWAGRRDARLRRDLAIRVTASIEL